MLVAIPAHAAEHAASMELEAAVKALDRGRNFKHRGYFKMAREQFEIALQMAPEDSEPHAQAQLELQYHLPLTEIHDRVNAGDLDGAERILQELAARNQQQPQRLQHINTMLRNLGLMRRSISVPPLSVDHNVVMRQVRSILEEYRRKRGRYPIGYAELNQTLPPNQAPLEHFVVSGYTGHGNGYVLELRNRYDSKQVLTLQNTGLLR